MPEEIMIIVIVAIVAGTLTSITKIIFGHMQSKSAKKEAIKGASLTTSELEHLMHAAVREGNLSLEARFDGLEDRLDQLEGARTLPPKKETITLEEDEVVADEVVASKRKQRF